MIEDLKNIIEPATKIHNCEFWGIEVLRGKKRPTLRVFIDTKIGADEIFFLFLFPGLDSLRVIISRVIKSKNILEPDNSHLHHLILKKVKHEYVWIIYLILTISIYLVFIFTNNILFSLLFSLLFYYIVFVIFNKKII